jgi:hypothetical protein
VTNWLSFSVTPKAASGIAGLIQRDVRGADLNLNAAASPEAMRRGAELNLVLTDLPGLGIITDSIVVLDLPGGVLLGNPLAQRRAQPALGDGPRTLMTALKQVHPPGGVLLVERSIEFQDGRTGQLQVFSEWGATVDQFAALLRDIERTLEKAVWFINIQVMAEFRQELAFLSEIERPGGHEALVSGRPVVQLQYIAAAGLYDAGRSVQRIGRHALEPVVIPAEQLFAMGGPGTGIHVLEQVELFERCVGQLVVDRGLTYAEGAVEGTANKGRDGHFVQIPAIGALLVELTILGIEEHVKDDGVFVGVAEDLVQIGVLLQIRIPARLFHPCLQLLGRQLLRHGGDNVPGSQADAAGMRAGVQAVPHQVQNASGIEAALIEVVKVELKGSNTFQVRRLLLGDDKLGEAEVAGADAANIAVAPGLPGHPFDDVIAVLTLVLGEHAGHFPLRTADAAVVAHHIAVAATDKILNIAGFNGGLKHGAAEFLRRGGKQLSVFPVYRNGKQTGKCAGRIRPVHIHCQLYAVACRHHYILLYDHFILRDGKSSLVHAGFLSLCIRNIPGPTQTQGGGPVQDREHSVGLHHFDKREIDDDHADQIDQGTEAAKFGGVFPGIPEIILGQTKHNGGGGRGGGQRQTRLYIVGHDSHHTKATLSVNLSFLIAITSPYLM